MKVKELIEILSTIENQEAVIMVSDTAAGQRNVDFVEDVLDHGIVYVINTKKK